MKKKRLKALLKSFFIRLAKPIEFKVSTIYRDSRINTFFVVYSKSEFTTESVNVSAQPFTRQLLKDLFDCHEIFYATLSSRYLARVRTWPWSIKNYHQFLWLLSKQWSIATFVNPDFRYSSNITSTIIYGSIESFID